MPTLVLDDGTVIDDSKKIVEWARANPAAARLRRPSVAGLSGSRRQGPHGIPVSAVRGEPALAAEGPTPAGERRHHALVQVAEKGDVLIAGAGPAGSTLAWALARNGLRPVVLERASFPREKVCGDGVDPRGLRIRRALGSVTGARAPTPREDHLDGHVRRLAAPLQRADPVLGHDRR